MFVQVREVRDTLAREVAALDPHALTPGDAVALLEDLAVIEKLAAGARTLVAGRAAQAATWKAEGYRAPDQWLAHQLGVTVSDARRTLDTATRLDDLPTTAEALKSGDLSAVQAVEVADAAAVDPAAEARLVELARGDRDVAHLKDTCRRTKLFAAGDPAARRQRIHAQRSLRCYDDHDGARHLHLRHHPEVVAEIEALLQPFTDHQFHTARRENRREPLHAYAADALLELARAAHHPDTPSDNSARRSPRETVVLVSLDALRRGHPAPDETCEIAGVGPISVDAARDHLGQGLLSVVITDGLDVRNVTVVGRTWTREQRLALLVRDPECVRPGCHNTDHLEIHHTTPYHQTLHSTVDEAARLCPSDHDLITHEGHDLYRGPDRSWQWRTPKDQATPDGPDP